METQKYITETPRSEDYSRDYAEPAIITLPTPSSTQSTATSTMVRPHNCHCGPDAPCRKSGICTCMSCLLKKLDGARN